MQDYLVLKNERNSKGYEICCMQKMKKESYTYLNSNLYTATFSVVDGLKI
jgi:hypothetical protein